MQGSIFANSGAKVNIFFKAYIIMCVFFYFNLIRAQCANIKKITVEISKPSHFMVTNAIQERTK